MRLSDLRVLDAQAGRHRNDRFCLDTKAPIMDADIQLFPGYTRQIGP
ncbi:hypothetical protein CBM2626_A60472 [Cupriavidus taiwanensis]|nr:hypothetical protein CBM2626_A60472 [Cupriavidus taiwanensis]